MLRMRMGLGIAGWIAGVVVCAVFPGIGECAGAGQIALLAEVSVSGDEILLANFLPPDAPGDVREAAGEVSLGATPQIGSVRLLEGAAVAGAMDQAGMEVERFVIPEMFSVVRDARLLSSEEILASLHRAMSRFSLSAEEIVVLRGVVAEDITWESGLRVPRGDARLSVEDLAVDRAAGLARFRVAVGSEERGVPFEVFARVPGRKAVVENAPRDSEVRLVPASAPRQAAGKTRNAEAGAGPVLVPSGKIARLRLHAENALILLDVKALEAGREGETIRVFVPSSGRTLRAEVTGPRLLDAIF